MKTFLKGKLYNLFLPLFIIILILVYIFYCWLKFEEKNYIESGFYSDIISINNIVDSANFINISKEVDSFYDLRKKLLSDGLINGLDNRAQSYYFKKISLIEKRESCFLYELDLTKEYNKKYKLYNLKNYLREDYKLLNNCSTGKECKLFFSNKGLLANNNTYSCN